MPNEIKPERVDKEIQNKAKIKLASFVGGKGSVLLFDGDVLEILGEHTMRVPCQSH